MFKTLNLAATCALLAGIAAGGLVLVEELTNGERVELKKVELAE